MIRITPPVWESPDSQEYYRDGTKGLELARSIPDGPRYDAYHTHIHFFWRNLRSFGRKQLLPIKAALATQDLENCTIHLWSDQNLDGNEHFAQVAPYIEHDRYNAVEQAIGTPLQDWVGLRAQDKDCYLDGDLARLLLLYNYGGVWVDMDMVLLRDLAPLLPHEWMYQWGTETHDSAQANRMNGAIMRMFSGSRLATDCLIELSRGNAGASSTDWGSTMYTRVREKNQRWVVWPCAFFNTEWQTGHNMGESAHPFHASSADVPLFDGAFAWHWHGKWDCEIEAGCKFERIEALINKKFDRKFNEKEYRFDHKNVHLGGNIAGGDDSTYTPALWDALINDLDVRSVLDVGCGEGHAVRYLQNRGVHAIGFDGIPINIERAPSTCFLHDLTLHPIRRDVDLVWACEVVEHIDQEHESRLIQTLKSGRYVAMTFAEPGQSGFHHVNCQPRDYWIEKLNSNGFSYLKHTTENMRAVCAESDGPQKRFAQSGILFYNRERGGSKSSTGELPEMTPDEFLRAAITGDTLADAADVEINSPRYCRNIAELGKRDQVIFCKTDFVGYLFEHLYRYDDTDRRFVLVTHNSDFPVSAELWENRPRCVKAWYGENVGIYREGLFALPLGLERVGGGGYSSDLQVIADALAKPAERSGEKLVFACFNVNNNRAERAPCRDHLAGKDYATYRDHGISFGDFVSACRTHRFVACPPGNGFDTHRVWEALYCGAIPILKQSAWAEQFNTLPVMIVNDWEEVTKKSLEACRDNILRREPDVRASALDKRVWHDCFRFSLEVPR